MNLKQLFDKIIASSADQMPKRKLTVATDCSGIESPLMALDLLKIPYIHVFSSEVDKHCIDFIQRNFKPEQIYYNLKDRDNSKYKDNPVDLYVAGFPCQTFSSLGRNEGFSNELKGTVFFYVYNFIDTNRPNAFILENVRTLATHDKGKTFETIKHCLDALGDYDISYEVLNTKDYGIPQSRNRMFIIGIKKSKKRCAFKFPTPLKKPVSLEDILDDIPQEQMSDRHRTLMLVIRSKYPELDFDNDLWVLNLNVSSIKWFRKGQPYTSPCVVTNSKYYIPKYGRYLTAKEALKLQGIPHLKYDFNFTDAVLYRFAGNTISTNVIMAILINVLKCIK